MNQEELKQRLIELCKKIPYGASVGAKFEQHFCEKIADHLIANGVTIRERGEWVCEWKSTFPQYEPSQYCCSNCGFIKNLEYSFCPHCGADMRGGKDESCSM